MSPLPACGLNPTNQTIMHTKEHSAGSLSQQLAWAIQALAIPKRSLRPRGTLSEERDSQYAVLTCKEKNGYS